jgi:hypothetical protein
MTDAELEEARRAAREAITKDVVKQALKEWLDQRYMEVGRWTVSAFFLAVFAGLIYLALVAEGWHK